jgi:hypothetical protein
VSHGLKQQIAGLGDASSNNYDLRVKNVYQPPDRRSNPPACIAESLKRRLITGGRGTAQLLRRDRTGVATSEAYQIVCTPRLTVQGGGSLHYGSAANEALEASSISTLTDRATRIEEYMPELGPEPVAPSIYFAVQQETSTHTGTQREKEAELRTAGGSDT